MKLSVMSNKLLFRHSFAGMFDLMRQHPRSQVTLVAGDIDLTIKAHYAKVGGDKDA